MKLTRKKLFRPGLEVAEARVLATSGVAGALHAASASAQTWVEVVNRTSQTQTFKLSASDGLVFQTEQLAPHAEAFYHADHAASEVLIQTSDGTTTALAASSSKAKAFAYSIQTDLSVTSGRDFQGRGLNGGTNANLNKVKFGIINQTSKPSGRGGFGVTIEYSFDGGLTFPSRAVIPYTDGRKPTDQILFFGNKGIYYRLPENHGLGVNRLNGVGNYLLLVTSNFAPYLSPTS